MKPLYEFNVPGIPVAKGRAKSRVVRTKGGKLTSMHYTPAQTRSFEAEVRHYASVARRASIDREFLSPMPYDDVPLPTGPLDLIVEFRFPVPDSWPEWKREAALDSRIQHTKKPDCSNLVKAIEDACNQVLWHDDGQVCGTIVDKRYALLPGVHVLVFRRDGEPTDTTKAKAILWNGDLLALPLGRRIRRGEGLLP